MVRPETCTNNYQNIGDADSVRFRRIWCCSWECSSRLVLWVEMFIHWTAISCAIKWTPRDKVHSLEMNIKRTLNLTKISCRRWRRQRRAMCNLHIFRRRSIYILIMDVLLHRRCPIFLFVCAWPQAKWAPIERENWINLCVTDDTL